MVAVVKIVNGKVKIYHVVSLATIVDTDERRTDGRLRAQECLRGMSWILKENDTEFFIKSDSCIQLFDHISHNLIGEWKIAVQMDVDGPWYPWKEGINQWDKSSPIYQG